MNTAFPILGSVLLLVLLLFFIQVLTLKWVRRKSRLAIRNKYAAEQVVLQSLTANFFGQTSKGKSQIRGNGALVLTTDELWFRMAIPHRELVIPLKDIVGISIVKSHLGKAKLYPLLFVEYQSLWGSDSAAWLVEYPEEWVKAIKEEKAG